MFERSFINMRNRNVTQKPMNFNTPTILDPKWSAFFLKNL